MLYCSPYPSCSTAKSVRLAVSDLRDSEALPRQPCLSGVWCLGYCLGLCRSPGLLSRIQPEVVTRERYRVRSLSAVSTGKLWRSMAVSAAIFAWVTS
jgi:hypothetical protein